MSGRRSHARFAVHLASEATLRVFREVHVQNADHHEVIAVSAEPAPIGQQFSIDTIGEPALIDEPVEVLDSRPVSIEGVIRHRLRLRRLAPRLQASAL